MVDERNRLIPESPSAEAYRVDEDQGDVFTHEDPLELFENWFSLAKENEPNDPNAMSLATIDAGGMPDVRIVLLKDINSAGLSFYTNVESAKGVALAANPVAALCFHWKSIRRQIRFRGAIEPVSQKEADAYFATRARGAQIGAIASRQSQPLRDREELQKEITATEQKFINQDILRPDYWSGYRLIPTHIEFWVNRPFRLHERKTFDRTMKNGKMSAWQSGQLYP